MNPVKCFHWYHGIYLQIVNIWSWLVRMFVWNTGSLHHWIDVTLDPNPMVWKGNSWDTTSNKLGKNKYIISLKSNLENPYSVFPQTPTLLYDSAWFVTSALMPRLGKAVLKNLLLGIIAAEFRIARDRMKQAPEKEDEFQVNPWKEHSHTVFPSQFLFEVFTLLRNSSDKAKKWSVQL